MEQLNGHANVNVAKLSSEEGVSHFAYVSADGKQVPSFILRGSVNVGLPKRLI